MNTLTASTSPPAQARRMSLQAILARWGDDGARRGMKHVTASKRVNIAIRQPLPERPAACMGGVKVRLTSISTLTRSAVRSYWQPHKLCLQFYLLQP